MHYTVNYLHKIYMQIKEKNPAYSLRAFAKKIDVPPGRFSEYMSGRRKITAEAIQKIAENAERSFPSVRREDLLQCFENDQKIEAGEFYRNNPISNEEFSQVKEWYYFAILSLMKTIDYEPRQAWMAHRLGLSSEIVGKALQVLLKVGYIEGGEGSWQCCKGSLNTTGLPDLSKVESFQQTLEQTLEAIDANADDVPMISVTMAMNPDKFPEMEKKINQFIHEMLDLASIPPRTEVYNLNLQLVPLTKIRKPLPEAAP